MNSTAIILMSLFLAGCSALPRSTVLLFDGPTPTNLKLKDLPSEWKNRLVSVGSESAPRMLGGSETHAHSFGHQHTATTQRTSNVVEPLGVRSVTTDVGHVHRVESLTTSPSTTSVSPHLPLSYGLNAEIFVGYFVWRVPNGMIIGYLGKDLPVGWKWCNGTDGAPDLSSRFILLDGATGAQGSVSHTHAADHAHTWATAENPDQPSYFGDPAPVTAPSIDVARRQHRHQMEPETTSRGAASSAINRPRSVSMRFIMATSDAKKIPEGGVIAFSGARAPLGWKVLDAYLGQPLVGRLWKADFESPDPATLSGESEHDHRITSEHEFSLAPEAGSAGQDRKGSGPAVPVAGHRHSVTVRDVSTTATASSMPPSVSLLLLTK